MTTETREHDATPDETAFHEVGHAMVMLMHGARVEFVTIEPTDDYLGRVRHTNLYGFPVATEMLRGNKNSRAWARGHLLDIARMNAAGPVAESFRRGTESPPLWGVGGGPFWDLPAGEVLEDYGCDAANIYAAFRFISPHNALASIGYEHRLLRDLRAYFKPRREVLRDLAVMLLRERTIPGDVMHDALYQAHERRGVDPYDPRMHGSWWWLPKPPTEEKTAR